MNLTIPIIFEDNEYLVINKPAGVTVNRAETTKHEQTVQDWAEEYLHITFKESSSKFGEEGWNPEEDFYSRGGIVHRLDKETSGILILAKIPSAFVNLQEQFRERTVKKTYTALAHGIIAPNEGEINVPVGRLPWNRSKFGILPGGKESKTLYTVLNYYTSSGAQRSREIDSSRQARTINPDDVLTLVELYPKSGRTHQIRVHLKYINHPIFSDFLYAGRKTARKDRTKLTRVFLHASKISFLKPSTGKNVSYEAPLAVELDHFLQSLKKISL
jgi:23S rRNA pseudouridine1911/1915/1917 synthase